VDNLGYAHHQLGAHARAADCYERAVALFREQGDRYNEATVLIRLGECRDDAGHREPARDEWRRALAILDEIGHPNADDVRARLGGR
jgi:tetratricopeptide (TPR) repeat protein